VQEREAFDAPIAEYQGISFPLADSLTELHAARLLTYHAAHAFDVLQDHKVVHSKVSMAKLYASEMAGGGRGYMVENRSREGSWRRPFVATPSPSTLV
jgi:alkylation response protein AidB-like acyl-CoA dehydrogenase